jgi:hypothetical protein
MASLDLREGMTIRPATIRRLTGEAVDLNATLGNPVDDARKKRPGKSKAGRRTVRKPG